MDEWKQASSPISNTTDSLPTTPCQLNDSFPESYTPFTLHRSDYTPEDSYADHSLYPMYSNVHAFGGHEYGSMHPRFLPCEIDHKAQVIQRDMDYSNFMASLPPHTHFESLTGLNQI